MWKFAYTIIETSLTDEIKGKYQSQIIATIKTPSERVVTSQSQNCVWYIIQLLTFNEVYSWLYGPDQWLIDRGQRPR